MTEQERLQLKQDFHANGFVIIRRFMEEAADLVVSYPFQLGNLGRLESALAFNYNISHVTKYDPTVITSARSPTRASCSPHRTGLAMDLFLGAAPGFRPDSSADPNRLYMSRTPEYRWLVANAGRFGFVNYPFEPWHWELRGAPASLPAPDAGRSSSPPRPATPPA